MTIGLVGLKRKEPSDGFDPRVARGPNEPELKNNVVLNLLCDKNLSPGKQKYQRRILSEIFEGLKQRIIYYRRMSGVPGVVVPVLVLQGSSAYEKLLDFSHIEQRGKRGSNDVRDIIEDIVTGGAGDQQKRNECEKILRCLVRWSPGLFPELTSVDRKPRLYFRDEAPRTVKTVMQILKEKEGLKLPSRIRAIDGQIIRDRIFHTCQSHVTENNPESRLLVDSGTPLHMPAGEAGFQ
jgi:hypothetical protein